jgi:hypothetical protein
VLDFVGAGARAGSAYTRIAASIRKTGHTTHTHTSHCTSYRAAFAAPARLKWAHTCGLELQPEPRERTGKLLRIADSCANRDSLSAAHELGMQLAAVTAEGAASVGDLGVLTWLHTEHGCSSLLPLQTAQLSAATLTCCAGRGRGECASQCLVPCVLLSRATWMRCATSAHKAASGRMTTTHAAQLQPTTGTWR